MTEENKKDDFEITEEIKKVVIARIDAQAPSTLRLAIGGHEGTISKEEMIEHVKKEDEIGKQIVKTHISFMKAVTSGELTKAISSV